MPDTHPKKNNEKENKSNAAVQPEPETLHTTDPQEEMKGPLSSLIRKTGEGFDTDKTQKQAEKEKEEKM